MAYLGAGICTLIMVAAVFLLFLSLPGTWVILGVSALWFGFAEPNAFTWQTIFLLGGLAVVGEVCEFVAGYYGAKRHGGSGKGSLGGIVGAILGAILGAPFFFGLGALAGSLLGAFAGCYVFEKLNGTKSAKALKISWGTTLGRFGGFVAKLGIALAMLYISIPVLWL